MNLFSVINVLKNSDNMNKGIKNSIEINMFNVIKETLILEK